MAFRPITEETQTGSFRPIDVGGVPIKPKPGISSIRQHAAGVLKVAGKETAEAAKAGLRQVGQGTARIFNLNGEREMFPGEGITQIASGAINTLASPLAPIASRTIGPIVSPILEGVDEEAFKIGGVPLQRAARYLGNAANIASVAVAPKVPGKVASFVDDLTRKSEAQIEASILRKYETGVKPLINAKRTPGQLDAYREDVVSGVKTINENKPNLRFESPDGEVIQGQAPKTLQQFTDSIEQTKKTLFTQYDSLAKSAGKAGGEISLSKVAPELDAVIGNKALSITNPRAIQYAKDLKDRLGSVGNLDTVTAQEVIQNYNKSLEAFYRNPTYETASQAAIDAMVANQLRTALDETITGLTGTQYSALKQQYGALKAMEKDVLKATLRDARKNTKGLIDFTDIFSGGQVVNGILNLNPGTIAQGVTAKAIAEFYKYLNNPNRAVEKLFNEVDQLQRLSPSSKVQAAPAATMSPTPNKNAIQSTLPDGDAIIKSNESNTNMAPDSTGGGILNRASQFLKSLFEDAKNNGQRGFIRNPFFRMTEARKASIKEEISKLETAINNTSDKTAKRRYAKARDVLKLMIRD